MLHRRIAPVEHHVRIANGSEIASPVHQEEWHRHSAFEDAMYQPSREVALLRMDEYGAGECCATVAREERCLDAVVYRSNSIGMQMQREEDR